MQNNFTLEIYVTSKLEEKIISAENFGKLRLAGKKYGVKILITLILEQNIYVLTNFVNPVSGDKI